MNLLQQCESAIAAHNQGMSVVIPLGIFWECQCNLLINCTEAPKKRAQLVESDGINLQIIKLNSSGNVCRYWGLKELHPRNVDDLNTQVVSLITHHLGMRRIRYEYISKQFCGGYANDDDTIPHAIEASTMVKDTNVSLDLFADCL